MAAKNYMRKYKIKDELNLIIESDKELDSELEKQDYFFQNFHQAFFVISSDVGISCLCVCRCKLCSWCKSFVRSTFWLLKCSISLFIASIKSVFSLCSVVFSLCSVLCSNAIAKRTRMYSLRVTSPL